MPALFIELLGGITVRRNDQPEIVGLTAKESGLLAYLIVTSGRVQRREVLAGLFWPEKPDEKARHSLTQAVYTLRSKLDGAGEPDILISERHTIELHPQADVEIDLVHFETALKTCKRHRHNKLAECDSCRSALSAAADLYQGPFMQGFTLPHCVAFEEWLTVQRERCQRQAVMMLQQLVASYEAVNELQTALAYARQWADLVPWQEAAHRQVMHLLALQGHRIEALAYFEAFTKLMREELHAEPHESTRWLIQDIRAGRIRAVTDRTTLLSLDIPSVSSEKTSPRSHLIKRQKQLDEMNQRLERAIAGEGQIVFVAGEAGSGKTVLLSQFGAESHRSHSDLLVLWGKGNAFVGSGDPYLPFRQALNLLTGEARYGYETGLLNEDQAQRLWEALPMAMEALADHAPDLIEAFLPGIDLLARISQAVEGEPGWLAALRHQLERSQTRASRINRTQLQEQTLALFRALSAQRPLLLVLDDLHWIDTDSVSLLFHMARSLEGMRLLIVGAFRQEIVDNGQEGRIHPLRLLLAESKRLSGYLRLDLNELPESERRAFLDALLDSERNDLDAVFRQSLFDRTEGHALFTVEMLHDLRERGVISWDEGSGWVQRQTAWGGVPTRAEGVIEARLARLDQDMQELLAIAAIEGEAFSAQTLAAALGRKTGEVIASLSSELDRRHQLVAEAGKSSLDGERLERFRFRHNLFRQHVYDRLGEHERQYWHARVGSVLEMQYGEKARQIASQLARHFAAAGEREKAITYWLQHGDSARTLFAYEQAEEAYESALALARKLGKQELEVRILMRLGLTQHNAQEYERAQDTYDRVFRLLEQTVDKRVLPQSTTTHPLRLFWGLAHRSVDPTLDFVSDLFSGLVAETPELEIVPDVAYRWEISDDGRTYVFHLRDDSRWSDGEPLTAGDFAFAWRHNRIPAFGEPLYDIKMGRMLDYGIVSDLGRVVVETPDAYTVIVRLAQPATYFLHLLAHPLAGPKPRHIVERYGHDWASPEHVVCNGPFVLERWDAASGKLIFVRNPFYHGSMSGNVTRVEAIYLQKVTDWQMLLEMYEADQVDFQQITNWPAQGYYAAKCRHAADFVRAPLPTVYLHCFDSRRSPFDDARVRQAFVLALDRTEFISANAPDTNTPALGGFIPPGIPGHSPQIGLPFNPDQARHLLAEAGYPDGNGFPEVRMTAFYSPSAHHTISRFRSLCDQYLGITLQTKILEWTAYWRDVQENPPHIAVMVGCGNYGDPDALMRQGYRILQKLTGWQSDAYTGLIDQAGRTVDNVQRIELYQKADMMLIDQAVILPVVYQDQAWLVKPWVSRFPLSQRAIGPCWKDVVLIEHHA